MIILALALSMVFFFPKNAFAYVDPGIVSMVSQWVYILVSGIVLVLFTNPWNYLKARFGKKTQVEEKKSEHSGS
jgi:hypothetical protein